MLLISLKLHAMVDLLTKRISVRSLYGITVADPKISKKRGGGRQTPSSFIANAHNDL